MKSCLSKLMACIILFSALTSAASANSGPTYMPASPGLEMAVDTDCPVVVDHEDLTFDFSGGAYADWSPLADVTASYTMTNPSEEAVSVTMAFRFIGSFEEDGREVKNVTVDGESIPFEFYFGDEVSKEGIISGAMDPSDISALDLGGVLERVITTCPPEPADGVMYTFSLSDSNDYGDLERIYVHLHVRSAYECYIRGSYDCTWNGDGSTELVWWNDTGYGETRSLSVFVSGGILSEYSVAAYEDADSEKALGAIGFDVSISAVSFRSFYEMSLQSLDTKTKYDDNIYWAFLAELEGGLSDYFLYYVPMSKIRSLMSVDDRLGMAVYTVEFKPGETKSVTVNCGLGGTMECLSGSSKAGATYTYTYLSNPAKSWADFGTLAITVIPPEGSALPLSFSAPGLVRSKDGTYRTDLDSLPDENIIFTLGKVTMPEKIFGAHGNFIAAALAAVIAITAAVTIARIRKRKKKTRDDQQWDSAHKPVSWPDEND